MNLKLQGKKALVTGGTRGIGRSIVECFASEGCHVGFCARTSAEVEKTSFSLAEKNVEIIGSILDIKDHTKLHEWINHTAQKLGGVDIYISNVSAQSYSWAENFQVDIMSCVYGIESALPFLSSSEAGSIVAIASKAAVLSVPSYKPYSAMKAALISYISSLSRELAPMGIRANCVSPGEIYFSGGFWERIQIEDPQLFKKTLASNPLGRFGTPEEVARAVAFLASPAASFISGTNLMVDGAGKEHVQF